MSPTSGILALLSVWLIYPAIWGLNVAFSAREVAHTGPLPMVAHIAVRFGPLVEHFVPSMFGTVLLLCILCSSKSDSTRIFLFHLVTIVAFVFTVLLMISVVCLRAH